MNLQTSNVEIAGRKPRSDSRLWQLPESRQEALIEFLASHRLAEAVAQLAAEGVETTASSLSRFRAGYRVRQGRLAEEGTLMAEAEALAGEECAQISPEEIFHRGERRFMARALQFEDDRAWSRVQRAWNERERLRQGREWMKLEERRIEILARRAEGAKKPEPEAREPLTQEEQEARWRQIFGLPEDWVFPGNRPKGTVGSTQQ